MLQNFHSSSAAMNADEGGEFSEFRQVLITASPILCEAIRRSYRKMHASFSLEPSKELCGLANISEVDNDGAELLSSKVDDSPSSFLSCSSEHFPLIVTFSTFLKMLDATLDKSFFSPSDSAAGTHTCLEIEVTFDRFASHCYPRLSEEVRAICDANPIFTEITSRIKGSLAALKFTDGYVDEATYLALAEERQSSISRLDRERLYAGFKKYEKLKKQAMTEFDMMEFVHYVYQSLTQEGFRGTKMQYVYIDEVQDLTPTQIALFKFVSDNPTGFVFAGDTAQTVYFLILPIFYYYMLLIICFTLQ